MKLENQVCTLNQSKRLQFLGVCQKLYAHYFDGNTAGFDTEAEARAAMLIHLLENNLTTAAEVNERLKTLNY